MRRIAVIVLVVSVTVCAALAVLHEHALATTAYATISERADKAYEYAKRHKMNTDYALFVDYSIPSGTPRLFVWDFNEMKIVARTYVMHGPGGGSTASTPVFSNRNGSHCSSLGKFRVTKENGRRNKRGFRLVGLERRNYNAYSRGIMIHHSKWVDRWRYKKYIPLNPACCLGCFTVSSKGMDYLEKLIKSEAEPLLLWSYC